VYWDMDVGSWSISLTSHGDRSTQPELYSLYSTRTPSVSLCLGAFRSHQCRRAPLSADGQSNTAKAKGKVFLYLYDLLIVSPNFEEHLDTLREVSQCLKEAGFAIGLKKSHFCFKELRYQKHAHSPKGQRG